MKRLAWLTTVGLATAMVMFSLWQFRQAVALFLVSLAVSATLRPVADWWVDRGAPRSVALLLIHLWAVGIFFGIVFWVSEPVLGEVQTGADNFVFAYDQLWVTWPQGSGFQQAVVKWLPPPNLLYETIAGEKGAAMLSGLLGITVSIFDVISQGGVVLLLSLYWGSDQARLERLWLSLLPVEYRAQARDIWRAIETGVGAYLRSELLQSLMAGLLLGVGYAVLGLKYPTLLAIISALVLLIPWLGAVVAVLLVFSVGFSINPGLGGLAASYALAIFALLQFVVEPRLFNRQPFSSLLVLVLVIALGDIWGLVGVVVAPPLAVALQVLFAHLLRQNTSMPATELAEQLADLETRLDAIGVVLADSAEPASPRAVSLIERLNRLIERARDALSMA